MHLKTGSTSFGVVDPAAPAVIHAAGFCATSKAYPNVCFQDRSSRPWQTPSTSGYPALVAELSFDHDIGEQELPPDLLDHLPQTVVARDLCLNTESSAHEAIGIAHKRLSIADTCNPRQKAVHFRKRTSYPCEVANAYPAFGMQYPREL